MSAEAGSSLDSFSPQAVYDAVEHLQPIPCTQETYSKVRQWLQIALSVQFNYHGSDDPRTRHANAEIVRLTELYHRQ